jgi:hypothetical protein
VTYNLQREAIKQIDDQRPALVAEGRFRHLLAWALPALLTSMIREALAGGGPEDEDKRWKRALADQATYGLGMLVGVRELSGAIQGYAGYRAPPACAASTSCTSSPPRSCRARARPTPAC